MTLAAEQMGEAERNGVTIGYLADHPDALPILAEAFRAESPEYFRDRSVADLVDQLLRPTLQRDALPLALIAHVDGTVAGTAALRAESITTHRHLTPWLAALHVLPAFRGRGLGENLIRAIEGEATRLGLASLYAGSGRAALLFERLGWQVLEWITYHGAPLAILRRELALSGRTEG